jgi:translation initiation factor eIF-2B subunit delta
MEDSTTPAALKSGGQDASGSATANGSGSQQPPAKEEQKLSNAELKKQAKAEKQAKRQARKTETSAGPSSSHAAPASDQPKAQQQSSSKASNSTPTTSTPSQSHSTSTPARQQTALPQKQLSTVGDLLAAADPSDKEVAMFKHLYAAPRRTTTAGASKDVHPAVLALGLQMNRYEVCGSTARCIAMLQVFKKV